MNEILYRAAEFRKANKDRSIDVVASTATVDNFGTMVRQDWNLDRYLKNPVVLFDHSIKKSRIDAEEMLPLGFATDISVKENQLLATLNFVDAAANPMAEMVYQGMLQGSIRGISAGFIPGTVELAQDGKTVVLGACELVEISIVAVPSNPNTVAEIRSLRDRAIKEAPLSPEALLEKRADEIYERALTTGRPIPRTEALQRALRVEDDLDARRRLKAEDDFEEREYRKRQAARDTDQRNMEHLEQRAQRYAEQFHVPLSVAMRHIASGGDDGPRAA